MKGTDKEQPETFIFRKAETGDADRIWEIVQQAIERRRLDGSRQWQDGYPNPGTVQTDIENGWGFVLTNETGVVAYSALIENDEPAYDQIDGAWLTQGDFLVVHRVAVSDRVAGKGVATRLFKAIEGYAVAQQMPSIKVDTNFDNPAMLRILDKLGYHYCGEVILMGAPRKAFEKVLGA
ncbi:GNAT family N-acetyltransferase [Niabella yanshanensis]|uniref:GNAT family N-acetyltransferase n=1 Tax=Niabella yanshanensis TaxID=577386 RepID=A0ABZ0WDH2_9BACT|nr:GNAT family N-acetyltransferase [Niabella yanshanensis]WQD40756.1 GNAT family N-acetyltransferase [Niabella yanshanensis]